jgi:predicted GNAT superfamily acetyltransferase
MSALSSAPPSLAAAARESANLAALRSGVRIEAVHDLERLEVARRVLAEIWQSAPDDPPVTRSLLRALTHAGNYCALACDGADVVGVCLGFLGIEPANTLHSHITGVARAAAGRHVGFALKLDQRAWALERGVAAISWTYDPLVRRNAFFNMSKLGAAPSEYVIDFYGDMSDAINAGQRTDRLVVTWELLAPAAIAGCAGESVEVDVRQLLSSGAEIVLDEIGERPIPGIGVPSASVRLVRVPADIEALRASAPELATEWRYAVREALGGLMHGGWSVKAVSRDGYYVLAHGSQSSQPGSRRNDSTDEV